MAKQAPLIVLGLVTLGLGYEFYTMLAPFLLPLFLAGVLATLPKPVLAVHNTRPCGACRDTSVDPDEVEKAIRSLLFFPFL